MVSETEVQAGVISSMRRTVKVVRFLSSAMILFSLVLVGYMAVVNGRYELVPVVSVLVGTAAGMIASVTAAKAWQSQAEAREAQLAAPPPAPPSSEGR